MPKPKPSPRLVVVNQTINPAFVRWVKSLAEESGPIELWCGNAVDNMGSNVIVRRMTTYDKSSLLSRLCTWGTFALVVVLRLLIRQNKVPLFVVTNPPFMPLIAVLLHRTRGYSFGLLEWDIYPQIAKVMGLLNEQHLLYHLWYKWHRQALRNAAVV